MDLKKLLLPFAAALLLFSATPQTATAQWSIGASYEIRNEDPQNGFGARIERDILQKLPIVNLGIRAHFSYFSEDNYVGRNNVTYGEITNYDYGLAAVGGVTVGPISPYVGLGLGASTLDIQGSDAQNPGADDSSVYWNGFIGSEVSLLPFIKPFVEYRLQDVSNYKDEISNISKQSDGRLIFGVSLQF